MKKDISVLTSVYKNDDAQNLELAVKSVPNQTLTPKQIVMVVDGTVEEDVNKSDEKIIEKPLISVIVPIYKTERFLERCINSIINQTYTNLEIILVNDGSPDNCATICKKLQQQDKRVLIVDKKNEGVSAARNAGLEIAKGEYVSFIDSDDYLNNDMYEKMIYKMINYNVDMVVCAFNRVENNKKIPQLYADVDQVVDIKNNDEFKEIFADKSSDMSCVWNKLYVRDKINFIFDKDIKYGEDRLFNFSYYNNINSIYYLSEPLYNYVIHNSSFINSSLSENLELRMKIFEKEKDFCNKRKNDKLLSFFCGEILKSFINTTYFRAIKYGKLEGKKYFKQNLHNSVILFSIKHCKERSLRAIVSKIIIKLKLYFLAYNIAALYNKRKTKIED